MPIPTPILAVVWPARLEYFSGWQALGLFALLATPVVLLGVRSLAGMGPARKWVAIGLRLAVLLLAVLILGGIRYQRQSKDLEVMVLRDVSQSTTMVTGTSRSKTLTGEPGQVPARRRRWPRPSRRGTRIGQISFQQDASIDTAAGDEPPAGDRRRGRSGPGGDRDRHRRPRSSSGWRPCSKDAMHRLVLVWDGNATTGDTDAAVNAAIAQHVPIDVVPLHYDVQHEVLMDRVRRPDVEAGERPVRRSTSILKSRPTTSP